MSELKPQHVPKPSVSQVDERRHRKPVLESQLDLLREGIFSDVTFIVGPSKERIPCHQLFLKSRSPVFQVMFSERWNQEKEIQLEDVDPKIFTKFLEFIYADNFEATVPEALGLLQVAHKYDVHLLVDKCEKLLDSEVKINCTVDVFQAARKYGKIPLMEKVGELMTKSLLELQSLPSFSRLDKETLTFILKNNDLKIKEVDIFHLASQWAKNHSGVTAQECLEGILSFIRFPLMTLEEFTKHVVPTGLLSQSKVIELFTYFGSDAETKKALAGTLEFSTERRKSPDSTVLVQINDGDYANKPWNLANFYRLRECVQFYTILGKSLRPTYFGCKDEKETIGLNGVTICCPRRETNWGKTQLRKFKIQLLAKDGCDGNNDLYQDQSYKELLSMSPVEMEERKETEIKFGTVIPVRQRTLYCIIVQEANVYAVPTIPGSNIEFMNHPRRFYAKKFGPIADTVDVNIDTECKTVLKIQKNQLNGFNQLVSPYPTLICKLGFEKL